MSLAGFAAWLQATAFSTTLQSTAWVVPLLQSLHILMIGVVFVSVLAVALKVLGWLRVEEPLERVWSRFAPFLWTGLVVMASTGLLLVVAEPVRELTSISFRIKMLLLVVGIAGAVAFGRRIARVPKHLPDIHPQPASMRAAAIATVVLWLVVIFLGRAIAYDDAIWGRGEAAQEQVTG
jgi:hypothetical protein